MMDDDTPANPDEQAADAPQGVAIPMGRAMPEVERLPVLTETPASAPDSMPGEGGQHSKIGEGLSFTGSATMAGSVTVAGEVQGDLVVEPGHDGSVTVTESGTVVGDIRARSISVLGSTVGTLDAGGGKVTLHGTASVSGRIRYTHLQVNGADLNAQLERVRPDVPGEGPQR